MGIPSKQEIKSTLKELRELIDTSKDPAVQRIAYGMETVITWVTEDTVGWDSPVTLASDLAAMLRTDLLR